MTRKHKRYQKQRNTELTNYVGSRFEHDTTGTSNEYRAVVTINGRPIFVREAVTGAQFAQHKYLHLDHLGSVTTITDQNAGAVLD